MDNKFEPIFTKSFMHAYKSMECISKLSYKGWESYPLLTTPNHSLTDGWSTILWPEQDFRLCDSGNCWCVWGQSAESRGHIVRALMRSSRPPNRSEGWISDSKEAGVSRQKLQNGQRVIDKRKYDPFWTWRGVRVGRGEGGDYLERI